mmetsp:Transcript_18706/g.30748  ORF Transcript_18706/g.30748 Transcript_18706/m.30748 type:complete len:418 (+) Transcript_18706:90-1343(+)|eukprot:CAMPEP_0184670760 /NCGR_PEP_ID=MMETSP0308-20130426/83726_1 /TAXON_ID=38269 /ORGANISM="Gloeochaete witrockiana, Strain SAG 46.84" /LENGTH=417 /DNA_ID=CAMNT_0027117631 /DNA_START=54 /DNA_END=1307 /DNA_ORIENTATION=+
MATTTPAPSAGEPAATAVTASAGAAAGAAGAAGDKVVKVPFDGKRMRKAPIQRRTVDYNSPAVKLVEGRVFHRDSRDYPTVVHDPSYLKDYLPPSVWVDNPVSSMTTKFVHLSQNKIRCPVNVVSWYPEGRRLITGAASGEFTLWNGLTFNFETILQAHDHPVRAMVWSHNEVWMVTGDHGGIIKYWQTNMNNVKAFQGHNESLRDIRFCPTDLKFASCSDDSTLKVWDFETCKEERVLTGHGWDVKCIDWHPQKALIVSGSKDNQIKLWDSKTGKNLNTLHGHKNAIVKVLWNMNGNWLLTAARDHLVKIFDIRTMKEMRSFRGHQREVTSLSCHPFHEEMFVSGSHDGTILFWLVREENPVAEIPNAHESAVWDLAWHPVGHILCSGSNDHTTKFWCRTRPIGQGSEKHVMQSNH